MKNKRDETEKKEEEKLLQAIKSRNIKFDFNDKKILEIKNLVPQIPQLAEHRVRIDTDDRLIWPVVILYPETMQTDFIQNFHENTR